MGSDIRNVNISTSNISSHSNKVGSHTLLYIDGMFRPPSSTSNPYPTIPGTYDWGDVDVASNNSYSEGSNGVTIDGANTDTAPYKLIGLTIIKTSSTTFSFNGSSYTVSNATLPLQDILETIFSSSEINAIFSESDTSAIGFVKGTHTTSSGDGIQLGSFKQPFNSTKSWFGNTNTSESINLSTFSGKSNAASTYSAMSTYDTTKYGLAVNPGAMANTSLEIIIALQ